MSWLPGLARARTMPERHVRLLGDDFPDRGIPATHSYNHHCSFRHFRLYINSRQTALFGFQKQRKKEMQLGSVLF
jgi:hypothetical protein